MTALGSSAYFFTLRLTADLGCNESLEHPSSLYQDESMTAIYQHLEQAFQGPFYAVIEASTGAQGERGDLHAHVIGHRADGPTHIRRDSERCKPVTDPIGLYSYLGKPPEVWSLGAEIDARAELVLSPGRRLPRTRRHFLGPQRLAWAAAQCPIAPNAASAPFLSPDFSLAITSSEGDSQTAEALVAASSPAFESKALAVHNDRDQAIFADFFRIANDADANSI